MVSMPSLGPVYERSNGDPFIKVCVEVILHWTVMYQIAKRQGTNNEVNDHFGSINKEP